MVAGVAISANGSSFPILTRNVSMTGLSAISDYAFHVGQKLSIRLPGIDAAPGRVVWFKARRFGFAFDDPIDVLAIAVSSTKGGTVEHHRMVHNPADSRRPGLRTR